MFLIFCILSNNQTKPYILRVPAKKIKLSNRFVFAAASSEPRLEPLKRDAGLAISAERIPLERPIQERECWRPSGLLARLRKPTAECR
jgi:hypothetical protein